MINLNSVRIYEVEIRFFFGMRYGNVVYGFFSELSIGLYICIINEIYICYVESSIRCIFYFGILLIDEIGYVLIFY